MSQAEPRAGSEGPPSGEAKGPLGNLFDLRGKVALVTGGGSGIGRAIAEALASGGAELAILGRSERVGVAAREIAPAHGVRVAALRLDLTRPGTGEKAVRSTVEALGSLDILVHAAGNQTRHPAEDFPLEEFDEIRDIHLRTAFALAQAAAGVMLPKGAGKIIFVASALSFTGGITVAPYAAAKSGVAGLTRALSNDWAPRGLRVNALAPGYFRTAMTEALVNDPKRNDEILSRVPAGRWGEPEDVAGAALFLASDASDYVTGAIIPVDGGVLAR